MGRCHTTLGLPSFARRLTGDERGGEDGNPLPSRCVQAYDLRPELKNSGGVGVIVSLLSFFSCPPFPPRIVCHATRKEASSQRAEETRGGMNGREVARLRWLRPPRRKEGAIMAGLSLLARNSSSFPLNNARRKIPHLRPRWRPARAGAGRTGGPA